jgi:hypothetical protein
MPQVRTATINMRGGLDVASPHNSISPGYVTEALNFEPVVTGGYKRIDGYERTHGNAVISSNKWYTLRVNNAALVTLNTVIINATSGATAYAFAADLINNQIGITNVTGTFASGDMLSVSSAVLLSDAIQNGCVDTSLMNQWRLLSDNYYRSSITPIPGVGNVLGLWCYKGVFYGFRRNGSTVVMYKSTGTGWVLVPFFRILKFDAGVLAEGDIAEGDTITGFTSGATAIVKRFVKNDGSYGTTASGYMVVSVTSGAFVDNELIKEGGVTRATANGADYAITLALGSNKFQFINYNFKASSDYFRVYGCDGVNPAFEFDGTVLTPILLPALPNAPLTNQPKYIAAHNNYLWLGFPKGSLQKSVIGDPLVWSGFLGAASYSMGDEITGIVSILDSVLMVTTKSGIIGISGLVEPFDRKILAGNTACIDSTTAISIRPFVLTQKGIIRVDQSQAYGNFESSALSRLIWPTLEAAIQSKTIIGAGISRLKNQYKIYFSDGTGIILTQDALNADQSLPSFTTFKYTHKPTCISSVSVSDTEDVLLFGDKDGYVYRENTGNNFDGQEIEYALRTPFESVGSPTVRKSFKRVEFDVNGGGYSDIRFSYELSYGQNHTVRSGASYINSIGLGGYWGVNNWSEFYWGAPIVSQKIQSITGTGHNISMLFYGKSATTDSFTLNSITLHYIPRRLNRG